MQRQKSPTTPPRQATYGDLVRKDTIALRTEPGTPPGQRQQSVAFLQRNPKRVRGSDGEYEEPITTAASQEDIGTSAENDYDPIFGIQVGRDTFVLTSEPGTPSTGQMALVGLGGEWRTCATRDDEPRPVWTSLSITHSVNAGDREIVCVTLSVGDHLETFCLPQATLRSQSWRAGR